MSFACGLFVQMSFFFSSSAAPVVRFGPRCLNQQGDRYGCVRFCCGVRDAFPFLRRQPAMFSVLAFFFGPCVLVAVVQLQDGVATNGVRLDWWVRVFCVATNSHVVSLCFLRISVASTVAWSSRSLNVVFVSLLVAVDCSRGETATDMKPTRPFVGVFFLFCSDESRSFKVRAGFDSFKMLLFHGTHDSFATLLETT